MPVYNLKIAKNNSLHPTGVWLQVTGATQNAVVVRWGTQSNGNFNSLPTGVRTGYSGTGTPDNPVVGDRLTFNGTFQSNTFTGQATYAGGGYLQASVAQDDCDWAATSN
jgi:hypothetical protein